jgi:hypothetical protein
MLPAEPRRVTTNPRVRRRHLKPGWPLAALLCLYPLWWAVGIGEFSFVLVAVPIGVDLWRRRPLRLPPAFGWWLLYLLWSVLSLVMLPMTAPGTAAGSVGGRAISIITNLVDLASVTLLLLYVGNLSLAELPQRRLLKWMSWLFVATVLGGVLGMIAPTFQFTSPVEALLPHSLTSNAYAASFVHPAAAQVQSNVLDQTTGRPAAPWGYTNFWGNNISLLLVWFCVYERQRARVRTLWLVAAVAVALVTIVYSLNRGVWLGVVLSIGYVVWHLTRRGDARALLASGIAIIVVVLAFFVTPLHSVVDQRAHHGQSNDVRAFLDKAAVSGGLRSPVLGWGGTRKAVGSAQSIAIGPSPQCPSCGGISIGSTGQLWSVVFEQGVVGLILYLGYFVMTLWRQRGDRTLIGCGTRLVVILSLFYLFFYSNLPAALAITMLSIGATWRQQPRAAVERRTVRAAALIPA